MSLSKLIVIIAATLNYPNEKIFYYRKLYFTTEKFTLLQKSLLFYRKLYYYMKSIFLQNLSQLKGERTVSLKALKMCTENINLWYKTIFTSFDKDTAELYDNLFV